MGSFVRRSLDLTFRLSTGTFGGGLDTVEMSGLRVSADINAPGLDSLATAHIRIYGMSKELMDRLTIIRWQSLGASLSQNEITVSTGGVVIFVGDIFEAMIDYSAAPDVPFIVQAQSGALNKNKPTAAESFPGPVKVETIAESIAAQLGATLENNGVDSVVTDTYLRGTPISKLFDLRRAADFEYYYVPPILAICPRGQGRANGEADSPLINVESGLVGWPTIDRWGVTFTTLYNPAIRHGGRLKIESSFPPVNGEFYAQSLRHILESEKPNGAWFTTVIATEQRFSVQR